jgi:hypothetical protein
MANISQTYVRRLFRQGDNALTTAAKGRALENLVCYIFQKIPGITITKRNALNAFNSEEIDVAFWNKRTAQGLYFLPNIILVECKNWSQPIGSAEVSWFDSKLRARALPFGILMAANGITGSAIDRASAHNIIERSLSDGRQLVVINRQEIESFNHSAQIVELIQEKLCELAVSGVIFL